MASIGMSSGSNIMVAPESNIRNVHTISAKGTIFGLGGRPRNLNEQSGAGVGHGYGGAVIEQAARSMDEHASQAYVGSQELRGANRSELPGAQGSSANLMDRFLDQSHAQILQQQSQQMKSSSLEPVQKLIARRKKFQILNPERKLDKYVKDLENVNVSQLARFMSNKKYYHKFYQLQELKRVSLMGPGGAINDKAFDLINNNSEFQSAVNNTLRIAPEYQAAANETDRDPQRKFEYKMLQESEKRYQNIWKSKKDRK